MLSRTDRRDGEPQSPMMEKSAQEAAPWENREQPILLLRTGCDFDEAYMPNRTQIRM